MSGLSLRIWSQAFGMAVSYLSGIVDLLCAAFFACLSCSPENSSRKTLFLMLAAIHLFDEPVSLCIPKMIQKLVFRVRQSPGVERS